MNKIRETVKRIGACPYWSVMAYMTLIPCGMDLPDVAKLFYLAISCIFCIFSIMNIRYYIKAKNSENAMLSFFLFLGNIILILWINSPTIIKIYGQALSPHIQ